MAALLVMPHVQSLLRFVELKVSDEPSYMISVVLPDFRIILFVPPHIGVFAEPIKV